MKRKRGNKKGKTKKPSVVGAKEVVPDVFSVNTEENSGLNDFDNDELDSSLEAGTPSSTGTDQPEKIANINSGGRVDKTAGNLVYGRVKVKIKTSRALDSQRTSSDAHTQSDTDKSSQQVGLEKLVVGEKMEDSANSTPENNIGILGNLSKKTGSIKIKSSRGFNSSSLSPCSNSGLMQGERTHQKEPELHRRDPRYSKQELNAALEVIKKVMKMDAAEPFNVPVNPIELGIPDYFDVIDTPMDFGTICSNLENGVKYMNSVDVFKDVEYIWNNCYKYNNKGDYILELMKRVKKNFTKYWIAAGLYSEQLQGNESIQAKDVAPSTHGKMPVKGGHLKHKTQKRHGVKRHKDGCLCAICVMMRRRLEREGNAQIDEDQIELSDDDLAQEVKPEETSPVESPHGDDTSSNMENSPGPDADVYLEEKGEDGLEANERLYSPLEERQEEGEEKEYEIAFPKSGVGENSEHSQLGDRSIEDHNQYQTPAVESGGDLQNDTKKEEISLQHEDETTAVEQQKYKKSAEKNRKAKMYENLRRFENPMLLELCGTLFTDKRKSIWSGPHSLVKREDSSHNNSIHAAITTFME